MIFTVNPAQYAHLLETLSSEPGCTIDQDRRTFTYEGVEIGYEYNGTDTLLLTVIKKPWVYPESIVESKITEAFNQFLSQETA